MKTRLFCTGLIALCFASGLPAWAQNEVTLEPSKDNTLYQQPSGTLSNGQGENIFAGRTNRGLRRRALLAFDVAGTVPAGVAIDSVKLTLTLSATIVRAQPVSLHRVLADWGEGASDAPDNEGQGGPAAPGDATWLHTFADTSFWENPGGDFDTTASASRDVDRFSAYTWGSTPEMVADVQGWLDAPETNFGWILIGNEDAFPTAKRFGSRENPDSEARPVLTIFYSLPTRTEEEEVVEAFYLAQNYPNPFNPVTTIVYEMRMPRRVKLEVYDVLGRAVAILVDGEKNMGIHQVRFDASGLPGGVYVYRLSAGTFNRHRTMVVLK